jgi:hypothetical protein
VHVLNALIVLNPHSRLTPAWLASHLCDLSTESTRMMKALVAEILLRYVAEAAHENAQKTP